MYDITLFRLIFLFSNLFLLLVIKQFNTISHQISILVWFLWAPLYLYYDQNNFQFYCEYVKKTRGRRFKFNKGPQEFISFIHSFHLVWFCSNKNIFVCAIRLSLVILSFVFENKRNIFYLEVISIFRQFY